MVAAQTGRLEVGPMSALGQKPTYALQQGMSALPPIATAKANNDRAENRPFLKNNFTNLDFVHPHVHRRRRHSEIESTSMR
jgi:hypothetical protein